MLVAALQISAQSNTRSRAISETEKPARESESTQTSRQAERPEKKAITRESNPAQRPTSRKR